MMVNTDAGLWQLADLPKDRVGGRDVEVTQVEVERRWVQLALDGRMNEQALDLRSEQQFITDMGVVEGLHSQPVAG